MITIDWGNLVIKVPKSYMPQIQASPFEIRSLDVNQFRLDLRALEASEDGMPFPETHSHSTERVLSGISYARFVEIINGYTVEFEDGQYGVSLSGANNNILDVKVPNQVSILANNSAGLINSEALNNQSFLLGRVYIDTTGKGVAGTTYPIGTPTKPSNNWEDANTILTNNSLSSVNLRGSLVYSGLNPSPYLGLSIYGESPINSIIVLDGRDSTGCIFVNLAITGQLNGVTTIRDCTLASSSFELSGLSGEVRESGLEGKLILDSTATKLIKFRDCESAVAGVGRPEVDCNNTAADIQFRKYVGGIKITNFTAGNNMTLDVLSGVVELTSSCTAGTIVIRGTVDLIDNSGAGCTVVKDGTITELINAGSDVWTQAEKEQVLGDAEDAKRQATIAAMNSQTVKQV